ncbi:DNA methyltransferase [Gulosibacter sp. 10]|uniref:DNA methyltransferase n=1 Tax=Gulosibacter sp. 10 TaxID=1255570 RepID=UPI001594F6AD|nr:site-specific DNA-methyltransferase [Gulosibacter sp. 10]
MSGTLLHELPGILAEGRLQARAALDGARAAAAPLEEAPRGRLIHGDNFEALARLVVEAEAEAGDGRGRAKLVYLDPPFDSKADYRSRILTQDDAGRRRALELHAYSDRWAGGTARYLRMLVPRLVLARELLAADGAICVHVDWHSSHWVRVVLDEVFGREHFVNCLVWSYRSGGASRTTSVPRKHDDLLLYRRSERFRVNPLYERQYLDKPFMGSRTDGQGRHVVDTILRDVLEGGLTLVDGDAVRELGVRPVLNLSAERTGYATQKPEGLLEVVLRWTTAAGDLVVDPFGGSGTTAVVADRLRRRWASVDVGDRAQAVARSRLDAAGAEYRCLAQGPAAEGAADYDWDGRRFSLRGVGVALPDRAPLGPARGEDAAAAASIREGSGLGTLAGWHLWLGGRRLLGAWRDARGGLGTEATAAGPVASATTLELIDLTGGRSVVEIPAPPSG